jgi:ELWxxDGT repeat protein
MVDKLNPSTGSSKGEFPLVQLTVVSGPDAGLSRSFRKAAICIGRDASNDFVLSDGFVSNRHGVIDLAADARPESLTVVGDTLFFSAADATDGQGLWKSDGSEAGTELVRLVERPASFTTMSGALYFVGDDGENGQELWTSDGTEAGTEMVRDIWEGANNGLMGVFNPSRLVVAGDTIYFPAADSPGDTARQLWKSDGTEAGTEMVMDFGGAISGLTPVGDSLFFYAGGDLWTTEGSEAGTSTVLDGEDMDFWGGDIALGESLIFVARDNSTEEGTRLWTSDGSTASSFSGDFEIDSTKFIPNRVTVGDTLYYLNQAEDSNINVLWKTDGTEAGTEEIKLLGNVAFNHPSLMVAGDTETLLVGARQLNIGTELWRSDGTTANTQMISDVCPEACDGFLGH